MSIEFSHPIFLICGGVLALLMILFFRITETKARKRMSRFAAQNLIASLTQDYSSTKQWIKHGLLTLALIFFFMALARPQWGYIEEETETQSADVLIALDTSKSMLAEDLKPNRLERAKLAIIDLLDAMEGDRIGLIAFSGRSFLQCPLTLDYSAFRETLNTLNSETIPKGGTDLSSAIQETIKYFEIEGSNKNLILITDGEDLQGRGLKAAKEAESKGIRIYTVGVGNPEGDLIPFTLPDGTRDYVRDESGVPVKSALDEASLNAIAQTTNGFYQPLASGGNTLISIYENIYRSNDKQTIQEVTQVPIERFHYPLMIGVILLLVEQLIGTRRRVLRSGLAMPLFILLSISQIISPEVKAQISEAKKAYKSTDYATAIEKYEAYLNAHPNRDNAKVLYNLGTAYYRENNFTEASRAFRQSLSTDNLNIQENAFYNLANSLVQNGEKKLDENSSISQNLWNEAITHYENVLTLNPEADDALNNLNLLKERINNLTLDLDLSASPPEGGEVTPQSLSFFYNTPIQIEAIANSGWRFDNWTGLSEEPIEEKQTTLNLSESKSGIANFIKTWHLEVLSSAPNEGSAMESGTYDANTDIPIKAEAEDYFAFAKWDASSGTIADPKAAETTIQINEDSTVTASFVPAFKLDVNIKPEIGGQAGNSGFFEEYSSVPIQAKPREGFIWESWEGDGIEDPNATETSVALTEDRSITAKVKRIWNLVLIPVPEEAGQPTGGGEYPIGTTVDINAGAADGYTFSHWEGPDIENPELSETQTTVESQEQTLFAIFEQDDSEEDNQDSNENQDQENQEQQNEEQNQDNQNSETNDQEEKQDQDPESDEENNKNESTDEEQETPPEESDESNQTEDNNETDPTEAPEEAIQPQSEAQLSPQEATELLNSINDEKNILPAFIQEERDNNKEPIKDW